ncbi:MAG: ThiF family adenylyltransferase [Gaiellaceae bacterium]
MRLQFENGWPFRHPRIFVEGMATGHVNAGGEVCLWQEGDPSRQWMTLNGFEKRVSDWVVEAEQGFPNDPVLDAHLYFASTRPGFATVDLTKLAPWARPGYKGRLVGAWNDAATVLALGKPSQGGSVKGSWYFVSLDGAPPRDFDSLRDVLTPKQRRFLTARLRDLVAGEERIVLLIWDDRSVRNALVVCLRRERRELVATAIEIAPTDIAYLARRAGRDFAELQGKGVTILGIGAIGSNVALRLAECGIGALALIDREPLRPSNVVRHAAPRAAVGWNKAEATKLLVPERVPWTTVRQFKTTSWKPDDLLDYLKKGNLVVDTTGLAGFTHMLSVICEDAAHPLVSAALFREGAVARVCRQGREGDTPIYARSRDERYLSIPRGEESFGLEPGCSAPVNNASPAAVAAVAALTAMVIIDALIERYEYDDETIDVYRSLGTTPFDHLGRVSLD